jgi:hypothetical protein
VAAGAQHTGLLAQQGAVAGDVRVVAGSALSALDRWMLDLGGKRVLQIVAAETDFFLVDLLSG